MNPAYTELNLGFSNAENYRRRENKALLERYFVRDAVLDRLLNPNIFYLVGEKGTGKTAFATYLSNNEKQGNRVATFDIRQTEYQKFLELKRQGYLPLSQYSEVWRTLLLIASATTILSFAGTPEFLRRFTKLKALKFAIDEFYEDAFAPEIVKMLSFVEQSELSTTLIAKHGGSSANLSGKASREMRDSASVFQTHLLKIRQEFEIALGALKLDSNYVIFIDGVDVRPGDIAYSDYFDCVRGLIEGVWSINNDFLTNIKGSKGRIRVVLLLRPDTFLRTGLHNLNTKLRDNSVFLDWNVTYKDYRASLLFRVADQILSAQQQTPGKLGDAWDYYFPFFAENVNSRSVSDSKGTNAFLAFLRFSYHRPRDITSMMTTIQDIVKRKRGHSNYVTADDFNDPTFRDAHAEYLLGEIRDQLLFYYSQDEYDLFLQFFSYLKGKRKFTYDAFGSAFNEFVAECTSADKAIPQFFESIPVFLQFLYEQNVICYREKDASANRNEADVFIRWCFRERTLSNMAPKVRLGVDYEIFYGLSKALNVGRHVRVRKTDSERVVGTIATLDEEKGYGFIRGGAEQTDYYFKVVEFVSADRSKLKIGARVSFEVHVKYGKVRAHSIKCERKVPASRVTREVPPGTD